MQNELLMCCKSGHMALATKAKPNSLLLEVAMNRTV